MDKLEKKALKDIDEYGCHILQVMGWNERPSFSYSIGIQKCTGQPELIVIGLDQRLCGFIINDYNARIKEGKIFDQGKLYDKFIEVFQVMFKEVEEKHYHDFFGWARWLYKGNDFKALQLIYPDTQGLWPWDKKASKILRTQIPKLYAGFENN